MIKCIDILLFTTCTRDKTYIKNEFTKLHIKNCDSSLISGQRLSEWCSNAYTLEEDIGFI